ncbi:MAG: hypothetical protein ABII81_02630 [Pseudomonadota bacterium]
MNTIHVVRQISTGLYLRMTKFDPDTQEPVYGPLEMAWIALNYEQADAQAAFLGDDHEAVKLQ